MIHDVEVTASFTVHEMSPEQIDKFIEKVGKELDLQFHGMLNGYVGTWQPKL